jgi:hypothetical protein
MVHCPVLGYVWLLLIALTDEEARDLLIFLDNMGVSQQEP